MNLVAQFTSLFAPDICIGCGREGRPLCLGCLPRLAPVPGRCYGCYAQITTGVSCLECLRANGFASLQAATAYQGLAQALVVQLKFHGSQSVVGVMSQLMAPLLEGQAHSVLVPMPATTQHVRQRGYDQALQLARALSRRTGIPYTQALARHGQHHQLGATREQRLQQLRGALRVTNPLAVRGQHIMLIDDVLTTGASLQAAATVLKAAGASQVSAWVFAQA